MTTRAKKTTTTIPTFRLLEKRVGQLRKDLERTASRVSREASRYIPPTSRRQLNDLLENVNDIAGTVSKRVTRTVETVVADVEDSVGDLRGTVDKRVKALRKDAVENGQKAFESVEKEARKQLDRLLKAIGIPLRGDIDGVKRRINAVERKLDDLIESLKEDESAAA